MSHPTCDVPFPPKKNGRYRKGMFSACPSYQGVRRSVWDPETFAPGRRGAPTLGSGYVIGTDRWRSGAAKVCHMAKRRVGYSTRRHMLEPVRPEAVLPDRALCLPTFSHFLIVNKISLSLSHSLSPSLPPLSGVIGCGGDRPVSCLLY